MPELVASCCTLLVLAPLALMPGLGTFLFRPMALAVAFAMIAAYLLSRSFVPSAVLAVAARRTHPQPRTVHHGSGLRAPQTSTSTAPPQGLLGRLFARWEALIDARHRLVRPPARRGHAAPPADGRRSPSSLLVAVVVGLLGTAAAPRVLPRGRRRRLRDLRPGPSRHADRGDREARSPRSRSSSARRSATTCELIISELGVVADWSAAYTPNAGPMDAVVKVQLNHDRDRSAQEYVHLLRERLRRRPASSATWSSPSTPAA